MSDATLPLHLEGVDRLSQPKAEAARVAVSTPAAAGDGPLPDEGGQDWHLLVTPGHVLGHRVLEVGRRLFPLALVATVAGVWLVGSAVLGNLAGFGGAPPSLVRALAVDPNTYAVLPGYEQRGDYRLAWLAGAVGTPQRGLTEEGWTQFASAALRDVATHGGQVDAYTELPKLDAQATVTRPKKALAEHAADLASGIVALPQDDPNTAAVLAAWVEGKLRMLAIQRAPRPACRVILGPPLPGCSGAIPSDLTALKPEGK